ncbi:MAG: 2-phosphosulfolactate phosphatase [Verrucomicrobiaceae bacterium]|nr:MAG: 2-phosphosulfolactate phosphatase [Verrucomicrobiaceae bacterium]
MIVDVVLNPAEIALLPQRDLSASTCVVFDVLRATSSMITGLAHGAAKIYPVTTIEEAMALKQHLPDAVLGGERHGELIDGFEIGNSPLEYLSLRGRTIITTTTNGTVALSACEKAERVLVGAILNIAAVAAELLRTQPAQVVLVCAGTFAEFALEDAIAAGLLITTLGDCDLTDSAYAAHAVAQRYPEPLDALRIARNGRVLMAKGRKEEVEWCAQQSRFNVVGFMEQGVIRPLPQIA